MNTETIKREPREFDIYAMLMVFWNNKAIYALFIFISFIVSIYLVYTARPVYKAEAVINVIEDRDESESAQDSSLRLTTFKVPGLSPNDKSSLIPKILGREFLVKIIKNENLAEVIKQSCTYSPPGTLSATGMLNLIGVYNIRPATNKQINENMVGCVRNMISIAEYEYAQIKTPAHTISVYHGNPEFAAQLANSIVDLFFADEKQTARSTYEKTMRYLSEIAAQSGSELDLEKQKLEYFLLETPTYQTTKITKGGLTQDFSMYNEKLADWGNLLDKREGLKRTIRRLESIIDDGYFDSNEILETFRLGTTADYSNLSRVFILEISELNRATQLSSKKKSNINQLMKQEIERLDQAFNSVSKLIEVERVEVEKVLKLNDKLSALKFNVASKEIYHDGILNTIKQKNLTMGQQSLKENELYTRATPPIEPSHPDIKGIIIVCFVLGLGSATIFLLVRQLFTQKIYTESQLDNIERLNNKVITLNFEDLKLKNLVSGNIKRSSVSKGNLISALIDNRNKGCFIEVDSKERYRGLSDLVSLFFANLVLNSNTNIMCMNSNILVTDQSLNGNNDRVVMASSVANEGAPRGKIVISEKKINTKDGNSSLTIEHDLKNYRKIFLNIDKDVSAFSELNLITECDFFVLVGKMGNLTVGNLKQYISNLGIDHEKFAGLVLVR